MRAIKTVISWLLLGFGLFLLVFPKIAHHPLVPVFTYHNLREYNPFLIPLVYVGSYFTRAWGAFVFAFMLGGVIAAFIPKEKMKSLLSGRRLRSYFFAALFAPVLTVCSCAMIPVFGGILIAGAGIGPAISFLLMAPAANILALIFTAEIISWRIAVARFVASFFGAIIIGYILDKTPWGRREAERYSRITAKKAQETLEYDFFDKSIDAMREAWGLAKKAIPYLILGVAAVSYVEAYLPKEIVVKYLSGIHGVVLGGAIGVPMYTPTLVEVFLVNSLIKLGMSPGSALAFLIGAPMASIPSMLGVSRIINWKCVLNYAILAIVLGILAGLFYMYFVKIL